jgi:two-component system, NarL family, sensor kinase
MFWTFISIEVLGSLVKDSLYNTLQALPDDTAKVEKLIVTARNLMYSQPDQAIEYCILASELSLKIKYSIGVADAYRINGAIQSDIKGNFDKAIRLYQQADSIYKRGKGVRFTAGIGAIFSCYGTIDQRKGNYVEALQNYLSASKVLEGINNTTILPITYNNLSTLYAFLKLFDKAEFYARQCIKLAKSKENKYLTSVGSITLADALMEQGITKDVLSLINTSYEIAKTRNDHYILFLCYYNYSTYYNTLDKKKGLTYSQMALTEAKLLGSQWEEARASINLSEHFFKNDQIDDSYKLINLALNLSRELNSKDLEKLALRVLASNENQLGKPQQAYHHLELAFQLSDTVFKEENRRQINYYEAMYQSEKKEKEILKLKDEEKIRILTIKRKTISNYFLLVVIVLLLGFSLVVYYNIRNKRIIVEQELKLQQQKILEFEKDKQILATQSVLQGEEAERSRLARDLHDGLGGLLSSVKLSLSNVKGNVMLPIEGVEQFDRALGLLDTSMRELRRVAHNMMPEALVKFGMKDAISDFCDNIGSNKGIILKFQFFGEAKRINSKFEISIYRIAQEFINNALKHANANELMVQLIQENNRVHLTVQDNGKGFDTSLLQTSKGAGFANVRSRVESLNGRFELFSEPDKGTEASVEFDWEPIS